jgi:hypothetical protein
VAFSASGDDGKLLELILKSERFRIWPPSDTSIMGPAQTLTDHDGIYTANAFTNFALEIQRAEGIGAP